jgi:hypothetical protein
MVARLEYFASHGDAFFESQAEHGLENGFKFVLEE